MAKRRKYQKLPNGYGSIKKLSGKRRNPYGVYPPATNEIAPGHFAPVKAICYVDSWLTGFAVLTAWHAGNYYPGYERTLSDLSGNPDRLLADYCQAFRAERQREVQPTFKEIYERFYKWKFEDSGKTYSKASMNGTRTAFKHCQTLHDKTFADLRHDDLQDTLDSCPRGHATLELILSLFHQMYAYADVYELCQKDYSAHVRIKKEDNERHGIAFTDEELRTLWRHRDDPTCEMLVIMCYSGFRISEYKVVEVNLEEKYFKGGLKTEASKNRIVPIYSHILPLVERRIDRDGCLLPETPPVFRKSMHRTLEELGISPHRPHDCRHTFSALCERYKVSENDRKRLLGHTFTDITNKVYGHRTVEDLRKEIEKIRLCC